MTATGASPHRVLIVDNDSRVRRALTELINATQGFVVVAAEGTGQTAQPTNSEATVAVVALGSAADQEALTHIRTLADRMPVVAVSAVSSVATAAARAGATTFCEMDGNTDALIAAFRTAVNSAVDDAEPTEPSNQ